MKKTYEPLQMTIMVIPASTPLLAGSVIYPGDPNMPPGAPSLDLDDLDEPTLDF